MVLYHPSLHYGLQAIDGLEEEFITTVDETLQDPEGWAKFGYKFRRSHKAKLKIILAPESVCVSAGISPGMSGYFYGKHIILLNYTNWNTGGKSNMDIDRYRRYVINHEVGHAIGRQHRKCPGDKCIAPVMMQMTKGEAHYAPCIANDRPTIHDALTLNDRFWFAYYTHYWFKIIMVFVLLIILLVGTMSIKKIINNLRS